VIDTRSLGRSPGSMHKVNRSVPAPADLGVGLVSIPEGTDIELDVRLEAVMEGVLVSGTARAPFTGECARCLDPLDSYVEADFQELFVYPDEDSEFSEPAEGDDEEGVNHLEGDLLDTEPMVRDAVVLALPQLALCREDCPGLCQECGAKLAEAGPDHRHGDPVDPRWSALGALKDTMNDEQEG